MINPWREIPRSGVCIIALETVFGFFLAHRKPEAWEQLLAPGRARVREAQLRSAWEIPKVNPVVSPKPRF